MRRDILSNMRARKAAVQYGHPSKGIQLIIVTGIEATTTARLLAELMRESGKRVAVFTAKESFIGDVPYTLAYQQSSTTVQQALAAARKQRCDVVIMEACGVLDRPQVLGTLYINMALVTDTTENSRSLLDQAFVYAVVPHGLSTENLAVASHHMISVGEAEGAEARLSDVKLFRRGTELTLTVDHQTVIELATHLVGRANATAAAFAAAAGYVLGVSVETIPEGIARLESLPGNFQSIESDGIAYQVAVDSASHDPVLAQLIASAKQLTRRRLMVVIDGTVDSQALHSIKTQVDRLVGVRGHSPELTDQASSLEEAISIAKRAAKKDDLILLVGQDFATIETDGRTKAEVMIDSKDGDK